MLHVKSTDSNGSELRDAESVRYKGGGSGHSIIQEETRCSELCPGGKKGPTINRDLIQES